jgi:hypothetical protein
LRGGELEEVTGAREWASPVKKVDPLRLPLMLPWEVKLPKFAVDVSVPLTSLHSVSPRAP